MMRSKKENLLDKYLLLKPTIRMVIEWPILIGIGILGSVFSWKTIPFFPISNIVGAILLVGGFIFHGASHAIHEQAHQESGKIEKLVTGSMYSKIRHPLYISLILMHFGFAFAWGIVWILLPVIIFSIFDVLTAIKEEEAMKEKFGKEYEEYMKRVPWRFLPRVF